MDPKETVASFPTYAALTETAAWAETAVGPVAAERAGDDASATSAVRYTEGALLGAGGMGKVLLAHDARIGRDVAVKVLHAEHELSAEQRARFVREAQVQGQLEHPSIVPVYDIDRRADGHMFFTMRRVVGKTLASIVDELRRGAPETRARYTQRELLGAFVTVCLTVDYAHTRGVIHRDLKPANLMLGDFGEVYVLDWGVARLVEPGAAAVVPASVDSAPRLSIPGELLGTPMYMAPEQMADPDVGPAADIYALGSILFELLALESLRDRNAPFVPPDARTSVRVPERGVPLELEAICVRATASDPAERYASARELQQAVASYLEGDRALEQRRALAATHAGLARAALTRVEASGDERDRGVAMRELARALALDPTNREHVAMFVEVTQNPPRVMPEVVRAQLDDESQRVVRNGAVASVWAMSAWFLFVPLLFAIGVRSLPQLALAAVPAAVSLGASFLALRQRYITTASQLVTMGAMLCGSAALSRLFGPLVLVPTLVTSYAIVLQAHPRSVMRRWGASMAVVAMTLPFALEVLGVIEPSYTFGPAGWTIVPHVLELSRAGTLGMIFVADLATIIVPCMFIAQMRAELSVVQQRLAIHAWHARRLGEELIAAA